MRVAASHLRVGTFEFFAAREEEVMLRWLLDYAVARHDPALAKLSDKPIPMLEAVCERQAQLIARWMGVGFIHGVMNTDNMSISGETIDYGPCAFMEGFDPATVFSLIDRRGAICLRPAAGHGAMEPGPSGRSVAAGSGRPRYRRRGTVDRWWPGLPCALTGIGPAAARKLGLAAEEPDDRAPGGRLPAAAAAGKVDFTLAFRLRPTPSRGRMPHCTTCSDGERPALSDWLARWRQRMAREEGPCRTAPQRRGRSIPS